MLVAMEDVRVSDPYYTPERVRSLLYLYPYLGLSQPPRDPALAGLAKRLFGPDGWREEAMAKRADIGRALEWLAQLDWRAAVAVRAHYCVRLPLRDVAEYLAKQDGREYHHETIRRWAKDAVPLMARFLSGGAS